MEKWYVFDDCGNVVDGIGFDDKSDAIMYFKDTYTDAHEMGLTLCRVLENDGCWDEVLEELTVDDI